MSTHLRMFLITTSAMTFFQVFPQVVDDRGTPYGPKLCNRFCANTAGCSLIQYEHSTLSCSLSIEEHTTIRNRSTNKLYRQRMVQSRTKGMVCVQDFKDGKLLWTRLTRNVGKVKQKLHLKTSLLVFPRHVKLTQVTKMNLDNHSLSIIQLPYSIMQAYLYIPTSKVFIIATYQRKVIFHDTVLKTNSELSTPIAILHMVADVNRKKVFYVGREGLTLGTFSTNGAGQRILQYFSYHSNSATVNEEKQHLYLSFRFDHQIRSLNYEGKDLGILKKAVSSSFLFYDPITRFFYFHNNYQVFTLDTTNWQQSKVLRVKIAIAYAVVYDNKFYLVSHRPEIYVVDLRTMTRTVIKLPYKRLRFCTLSLM